MFGTARSRSTLGLTFSMASLVFHTTARKVRQVHGNAFVSILMSITQSLLFFGAFYLMFTFLGMRGMAIRGDFMLYLLSGIFLFLTHIQTLNAVSMAEGPTSPMMQHAPMNTLVAILSAAFSTLYIKAVSVLIILFLIHTLSTPLEFYYWPGALMMFLLAWASGVGLGIIFMAIKPWRPDLINIIKLVYMRANMIASGKMFVANMMPSSVVVFFQWNPLFHLIDQSRGFTFKNYFPHYTNWEYPLYATIVLIMLGLMGDFFTRKHASASWGARH